MGFGSHLGRLWWSLFDYTGFTGIWFSLGYDREEDAIIFQFQLLWLQFIIGFDM